VSVTLTVETAFTSMDVGAIVSAMAGCWNVCHRVTPETEFVPLVQKPYVPDRFVSLLAVLVAVIVATTTSGAAASATDADIRQFDFVVPPLVALNVIM